VIDSGWRQGPDDYEFLISPRAHELLQQERIVMIDYRPIQQAWSQPTASRQTLREHAQWYSSSAFAGQPLQPAKIPMKITRIS
jgi:hypothetical protein